MELARIQVDVAHLGHQDAHVVVALEDRPQRIGDFAGRQRAGRDLVGQRLEQVEIPAIDERDLHRCPAQPERGLKPAEAAADDDDAMGARVIHASLQPAFESAKWEPLTGCMISSARPRGAAADA